MGAFALHDLQTIEYLAMRRFLPNCQDHGFSRPALSPELLQCAQAAMGAPDRFDCRKRSGDFRLSKLTIRIINLVQLTNE